MDLFAKLPPVKAGNLGKRKLPDEPTEELLKKYRTDDGDARERTRIEDVDDENRDDAFNTAGPDNFDDAEDEDGGRMYGGGISSEMKKVFEVRRSSQPQLSMNSLNRSHSGRGSARRGTGLMNQTEKFVPTWPGLYIPPGFSRKSRKRWTLRS
jgi:hypothetical protein